jgi:hypothetical protein
LEQQNFEWGMKMKRLTKVSLLPLLALSACGPAISVVDDPSNIPLRGQWSDEGKLMSVMVGGAAVDSTTFPEIADLGSRISGKKDFCGEPHFLDKESFQQQIDENNGGKCQVVRRLIPRATG